MIGLALYYAGHTLKNSVLRLLRSKALAVILIIFVVAGVIGFAAGRLGDMAETPETPEAETEAQEELTQEDRQEIRAITEIVAGGILMGSLLLNLWRGQKSGADIFPMSDVNFLFPAPRKPQSILMFRLLLQMGTALVGSVYLVFQLPNLMINVGLTLGQALWIFVLWVTMLIFGKLVGVWSYVTCSNHPGLKKLLPWFCLGIPAATGIAVAALAVPVGMGWWTAAKLLLASPGSRLVPIWGWMKGILGFSLVGEYGWGLLCLAGVMAAGTALSWIIWRMKADFYEDALVHAADVQKTVEEAGRGMASGKVRSEKIRRDGFSVGSGEKMFFVKAMYHRRRLAKLGLFTKTQLVYGAACAGAGVILRLADSKNLLIPGILLTLLVYFRNYGNPISEEENRPFLYLVPALPGKKLLWCVAAGTCQTLLDLVPGLLLLWLIPGGNLFAVLGWMLLAVGVDVMASAMGLMLELQLPEHLGLIRAILELTLKFLALLPAGILLLVGGVLQLLWLAIPVAGVLSAVAGWLIIEVNQGALHDGRK